jgi:hypothetical protein
MLVLFVATVAAVVAVMFVGGGQAATPTVGAKTCPRGTPLRIGVSVVDSCIPRQEG